MRILWFVNDPLPAVSAHFGRRDMGSGHWMPCLLNQLAPTPGLQLAVVTAYQGLPDRKFESGGVTYFVIGQPRFQPFFGCRKRDLERAVEIVREWAPDVIHIHGTERFYGLLTARKLIPTPCVISLQGLIGPYVNAFLGGLSIRDLWRSESLIELATRRGLLWRYRDFYVGAKQEREIISGARAFMGRTDWDRTQVRSINPDADYFYAGEILRSDFREASWDVSQCDRHSIIFTNAGEPRRGTEVLLHALLLIRRDFPDAKLRLAGSVGGRRGYGRYLQRTIAESGLSKSVEVLGYLDGNAMAKALSKSHVFAISSYLENSPNSLCEAMQVGLPCVATYVGGIPNLVEHQHTGLLFPPGDAPLLADAITRIFRDDDLAARLSRSARTEASERHDPKRVASQVLNTYHRMVENAHGTQDCQTLCRS